MAGDTVGEIFVEAPLPRYAAFADFDHVRFVACASNGKPIGVFPSVPSNIATDDGVGGTNTSNVAADGSSSTVTRR